MCSTSSCPKLNKIEEDIVDILLLPVMDTEKETATKPIYYIVFLTAPQD